jgi:hypothetical protein
MDHQPGRLVHDHAVVVLVQDLDRNGLAGERGLQLGGNDDPHAGPFGQRVAAFADGHPVHRYPSLVDQPADAGAAEGQSLGEGAIDPAGRLSDDEFVNGLRPPGRRAQRALR